ncbi:unnamed protein product [Arctogadus glacialis]
MSSSQITCNHNAAATVSSGTDLQHSSGESVNGCEYDIRSWGWCASSSTFLAARVHSQLRPGENMSAHNEREKNPSGNQLFVSSFRTTKVSESVGQRAPVEAGARWGPGSRCPCQHASFWGFSLRTRGVDQEEPWKSQRSFKGQHVDWWK